MKKIKIMLGLLLMLTLVIGCQPQTEEKPKIIDRSGYGLEDFIFEDLPDAPDDFWWIKDRLQKGEIPMDRYNAITWEHFAQPEFYSNWEACLNAYKNPPANKRGVYGYGSYPAEQGQIVDQEDMYVGMNLTAVTFFRTGCGIDTYQGTWLKPQYNENYKEYFSVDLFPDIFMLMPTKPKFNKDWARGIAYRVTVKKVPVPKGTYDFGMIVTPPPADLNEDWEWKYKENYVKSGMFSASKTFDFIIEVK